jgi:hypothetical protein
LFDAKLGKPKIRMIKVRTVITTESINLFIVIFENKRKTNIEIKNISWNFLCMTEPNLELRKYARPPTQNCQSLEKVK